MKLWMKKDYINLIIGLAMLGISFLAVVSFELSFWATVLVLILVILFFGGRTIYRGVKRQKYKKAEKISYIILGGLAVGMGITLMIIALIFTDSTSAILVVILALTFLVIAIVRVVSDVTHEKVPSWFRAIDLFIASFIIAFCIIIVQAGINPARYPHLEMQGIVLTTFILTAISRILVALFGDEGPAPLIVWAPPTEDYIPKK